MKELLSIKVGEQGEFVIDYDEVADSGMRASKMAASLYKLMLNHPELIEDIMAACRAAAEDIAKPLCDIIK